MKKSATNKFIKTSLYLLGIWIYCFILYWTCGFIAENFSELQPIRNPINASLFEPLILMAHLLILYVLTARLFLSVLILSCLYIIFIFINIEMMNVFELIFSPSDIKHSIQVIFAKEVLVSYWLQIMMFLLAVILLMFFYLKSRPNAILKQHQLKLLVLVFITLFITVIFKNEIAQTIKKNFKLPGQAVPHVFAEKHGFLFSFYYQYFKLKDVESPDNYSKENIQKIIEKYSGELLSEKYQKPDVIIFFIEAFADPLQVGIKTTRDPIPNFRKYQNKSLSGLVVSPEIGGRSANPEFELLTGLSMRFVPEKSIPYIDFIHTPYPSIVNEFKNNGYKTSALHVASLSFFNYEKVYPLLGFEHIETLYKKPGIELDPVNRFPSENALVDRIIEITTAKSQPQFVFSFPNSTHGMWTYDSYLGSELDIIGSSLNKRNTNLKTYINAIHQADIAVGKLINYFKQTGKPTIIMVLGDHQPGLPEFRSKLMLQYYDAQGIDVEKKSRKSLKRLFKVKVLEDDPLIYLQSHQVPYFIWSSEGDLKSQQNTSMNFMTVQLAQMAGIKLSPLYILISEMQKKVKSLHKKSKLSKEYDLLINDYHMIQYDVMYGQQYYLEITNGER